MAPHEQWPWLKWVDNPVDARRCPFCMTEDDDFAAWQEASERYAFMLNPTQYDGKPDRDTRSRFQDLSLALQRREECRRHPNARQERQAAPVDGSRPCPAEGGEEDPNGHD